MSPVSFTGARLLDGKVAIVVGASRGIGAATKVLGASGAKVVLAARDTKGLEAVARTIREGGGEALAVRTDVLDAKQLAALVETSVGKFGRVDVAFNNAGAGNMLKPLVDMSVEEIDESLALNLAASCSR